MVKYILATIILLCNILPAYALDIRKIEPGETVRQNYIQELCIDGMKFIIIQDSLVQVFVPVENKIRTFHPSGDGYHSTIITSVPAACSKQRK